VASRRFRSSLEPPPMSYMKKVILGKEEEESRVLLCYPFVEELFLCITSKN